MSEASVIQKSIRPQTKDTLKEDFQKIGIQKGDIVLVHSSMSQIGWIAGREIAVIEALIETDYSPESWQKLQALVEKTVSQNCGKILLFQPIGYL